MVSTFRKYQESAPDLPLDEQLDTALLLDISVSATRDLNISVALYTKAGVTYNFILPVPITK